MAEIPVEKRSGIPPWVWILLALLLVGLLAWWLLDDDDGDVVDYADTDVVAGAAAAYAIGDDVDLEGVRVSSLAGDMAFYADVEGGPMLVVFNEDQTPGTAMEGEKDINPGMMVDIEGEVRSASTPLPAGYNATIPSSEAMYILARDVETR